MRSQDLADRITSIVREITPFLLAADLTVEDLGRDSAGVGDHLATVARDYRALREEVSVLDSRLRSLAPQRAATIAALDAAKTAGVEVALRLEQRRLVLEEKRSQRSGLLEGEATNIRRRLAMKKLLRQRKLRSAVTKRPSAHLPLAA